MASFPPGWYAWSVLMRSAVSQCYTDGVGFCFALKYHLVTFQLVYQVHGDEITAGQDEISFGIMQRFPERPDPFLGFLLQISVAIQQRCSLKESAHRFIHTK